MAVVDVMGSTRLVQPRIRRSPQRVAGTLLTLLFGAIIAINLSAWVVFDSPYFKSHLAAAFLAAYLLIECRMYLRRSDTFGILSPAFLAVPGHFLLSYLVGITAAVFEPRVVSRFKYWMSDLDTALASILLLAGLSAFCMLRGYGLAQRPARLLRQSVRRAKLFRSEIRPRLLLALLAQVVFVLLVALAIKLGVFGLVGTQEALVKHTAIREYLRLATATGTLSYFLILFAYFQRRAQGRASLLFGMLCALMVILHVAIGAISAFKSQIVFPFIIAGLAYFIASYRIPIRFIYASAFALVVAYMVIEPYRVYLRVDGAQDSIGDAAGSLVTAVQSREQLVGHSGLSMGEQIARRFDLSGMSAVGVDYAVQGRLPQEFRHHLRESILLAPVLAFVPRLLWPGKPSYSTGAWFNQEVLGAARKSSTSVGMGPIAFLYMAGGIVAVCLGFFFFGVLQALIFDGLARGRVGGIIVYLGVAGPLIMIPSDFGPALTGVLRMLPLAIFVQLLLLRAAPGKFAP